MAINNSTMIIPGQSINYFNLTRHEKFPGTQTYVSVLTGREQ